jgi:hypothetical protein
MISCQSQSDALIRQVISLVAQICTGSEFQALKEELAAVYEEAGRENPGVVAYEDALYALILQYEDVSPDLKELLQS